MSQLKYYDTGSGQWLPVLAGAQGIQGTTGLQGTTGTQGFVGTQGILGNQGTQGVQGVQGLQGLQGTQGTQGLQGIYGQYASVLSITSNSATPSINTNLYNVVHITGQSTAITSFTTNLTGTPADGATLRITITGTTAIALTWGASFESSTMVLPTTTTSTNRLDVGFFWNTETSKWRCVAVA